MSPLPTAADSGDEPAVRVPPAKVRHAQDALAAPARIRSDELFIGGATELLIDHRGVLYRLKKTSLGKLILTK